MGTRPSATRYVFTTWPARKSVSVCAAFTTTMLSAMSALLAEATCALRTVWLAWAAVAELALAVAIGCPPDPAATATARVPARRLGSIEASGSGGGTHARTSRARRVELGGGGGAAEEGLASNCGQYVGWTS